MGKNIGQNHFGYPDMINYIFVIKQIVSKINFALLYSSFTLASARVNNYLHKKFKVTGSTELLIVTVKPLVTYR